MKKYMILFFFILVFTSSAIAETTVIVNGSLPVNELSEYDLKQIFIGKKRNWKNGDLIVPVTLTSGNTHKSFLNRFLKKSESQFKTYWKKMVFTGKAQALKEFDSEKDLVAFVASTKGAVGYIDSATPHEGMKKINIR